MQVVGGSNPLAPTKSKKEKVSYPLVETFSFLDLGWGNGTEAEVHKNAGSVFGHGVAMAPKGRRPWMVAANPLAPTNFSNIWNDFWNRSCLIFSRLPKTTACPGSVLVCSAKKLLLLSSVTDTCPYFTKGCPGF